MTCHSGGAPGSDIYWDEVGKKYGVNTVHYYYGDKSEYNSPYGNQLITEEDYEEGRYKVAEAARWNWGYLYKTMKDPRLVRDWCQVKYSDAVFAVGRIVLPGQLVFPGKRGDSRIARVECVSGGTGYAVAMAILNKKKVYVYDQLLESWFTWIWHDEETGEFIGLGEVPKLTENFAGIGTREINDYGKEAIEGIYAYTFNN